MEIVILILMLPALLLPALEGKHMDRLENTIKKQEKRISELENRLAVEDVPEDFEQVYAKGLAGIMAYSLKEAGREEEII